MKFPKQLGEVSTGNAIEKVVHEAEPESLAVCAPVDLDERTRRVFNVAEILWNSARVKYPEMPAWGDNEACVETVAMVEQYSRTKQWSPIPVGTPAANDESLQRMLCETASTLLPASYGVRGVEVQRPRVGWGSGRTQPTHTVDEVNAATLMGMNALFGQHAVRKRQDPNTPALRWPNRTADTDTIKHYEAWARKVLTLAKIHQIDAIRVAVVEHGIPPVFAGPIVADVCLGGAARVT